MAKKENKVEANGVLDENPKTPDVKTAEPKITDEQRKFAQHILEQNKNLEAVYVVDGLYFSDKVRAEARESKDGVVEVKR